MLNAEMSPTPTPAPQMTIVDQETGFPAYRRVMKDLAELGQFEIKNGCYRRIDAMSISTKGSDIGINKYLDQTLVRLGKKETVGMRGRLVQFLEENAKNIKADKINPHKRINPANKMMYDFELTDGKVTAENKPKKTDMPDRPANKVQNRKGKTTIVGFAAKIGQGLKTTAQNFANKVFKFAQNFPVSQKNRKPASNKFMPAHVVIPMTQDQPHIIAQAAPSTVAEALKRNSQTNGLGFDGQMGDPPNVFHIPPDFQHGLPETRTRLSHVQRPSHVAQPASVSTATSVYVSRPMARAENPVPVIALKEAYELRAQTNEIFLPKIALEPCISLQEKAVTPTAGIIEPRLTPSEKRSAHPSAKNKSLFDRFHWQVPSFTAILITTSLLAAAFGTNKTSMTQKEIVTKTKVIEAKITPSNDNAPASNISYRQNNASKPSSAWKKNKKTVAHLHHAGSAAHKPARVSPTEESIVMLFQKDNLAMTVPLIQLQPDMHMGIDIANITLPVPACL